MRPLEDVPFKVVQERWSTYDLGDGLQLKARVVLLKVLKPPGVPIRDLREMSYQIHTHFVVYAPVEKKGEPEPRPITRELVESSIIRDLDPRPIEEHVNEYILEDGSLIRLRLMLVRVSLTSLHSSDGAPIVAIQHQVVPQIVFRGEREERREELSSVV